ncbi:hypothetical protein [Roseiconus lacunae]|uniref:hypothetical protein n=1 Tax=Roseiconus lacunae TaxID=2605694 RepID=UPI0011F11836|nr:hypothetical protein [Roseiconus lacunae]
MDIETSFAELLDIAKQIGAGVIPEYRSSESFTVGAFDIAFSKLRDGEAFALLSYACREYPSVKSDSALLHGYLFMITDLAHCTNTTEIPDAMNLIIDENPLETTRLQRWYRINPSAM